MVAVLGRSHNYVVARDDGLGIASDGVKSAGGFQVFGDDALAEGCLTAADEGDFVRQGLERVGVKNRLEEKRIRHIAVQRRPVVVDVLSPEPGQRGWVGAGGGEVPSH